MECTKRICPEDWEEGIYVTVIKEKLFEKVSTSMTTCVVTQGVDTSGMHDIYRVEAINYPCVLLTQLTGFSEDNTPIQWNANEYCFGKLSNDYVTKALGTYVTKVLENKEESK